MVVLVYLAGQKYIIRKLNPFSPLCYAMTVDISGGKYV